ncbi:hypothetical protein [Priestia megaterium]|uniref:Uncharacterized protein n=1 Tax=Priestia megaterium TaxID=1404 RepID=A0A6M6DZQ5_PRIMG|nr:hypothetical protein [Priestia megaterium]QJX80383.1 hypothetical protein FDZ14_30315 [Priestia megaterium]
MVLQDWIIANKAEEMGLMVSMVGEVENLKIEKNIELSKYFIEKIPNFQKDYEDNMYEFAIGGIEAYLEEINADIQSIEYPVTGREVHLIPIGENIKLKVYIEDEEYGENRIEINSFMINHNTTKEDVDVLIEFIKEYLPF